MLIKTLHANRRLVDGHSNGSRQSARLLRVAAVAALLPALGACAVVSTSVGPTRGAIEKAPSSTVVPGLQVVDLTTAVAHSSALSSQVDAAQTRSFAEALGGASPIGTTVGVGDMVEVTIWEASPPALFGSGTVDPGSPSGSGSRPQALPVFVVGPSGTISVPFAGQVPAAGRTVSEIERDIVRRLTGLAHRPQAVVRIARNVTETVSVLGDVDTAGQVPLTPHGERVLDVISQAGGTTEPLDRVTVQVTRRDTVRRIAARDLIRNPESNVVLQGGDVVTVLYQPNSFTVLGAAGANAEVRFEGVGLTLSQALGRMGGLESERADAKGVFIFRWEKPAALPVAVIDASAGYSSVPGAIPVIYRANLREPETYFAAQRFQIQDGDVLYVANSRVADLQRFVSILASSILPFSAVRNVTR